MTAVHASPFAGSWYPQDISGLERLLEDCWKRSCGRTGPLLNGALGYVVPHAGPQYSGTVAAAVYRLIEQQKPERVVVLAFPHRGGLRGVAVPDVRAISTPLGTVELDCESLLAFPSAPEECVCDHSFEIQLPFLQKAAPQARIAVLYVGRLSDEERRQAAATLAAAFSPGTVLVASSDFTHYGASFGFMPFPADANAPRRLRELDTDCADAAGSGDASLFLATLETNGATVCGTGPIALLLDTLRLVSADGIYQSQLDYQTSGEITGDYRHSVSYAAQGYYPPAAYRIDSADSQALLASAADTLRLLRETGGRVPVPVVRPQTALQMRRGAFVTLRHDGELLGCVGNVNGHRPLAEEVAELTLAAALDDPRFRPATDAEGEIEIEISILTPLRRIRDAADVQIGRHGLFLRVGKRSGLLLPQVASERGWSAEEFLRALTRKSLAAPYAWRDPQARLYVFEAQILQ
jgi:AmmeMemoRadiSam system protein B/AmmeMemoRadiSam system protein A